MDTKKNGSEIKENQVKEGAVKGVVKKPRRRLNKKMRNVFIAEGIIFAFFFCFVFYCQFFVAKNGIKESLKYSLSVIVPLLIYAIPTGFSFLIRGQLFVGDYESPLKADDSKGSVSDGDRNFAVANLVGRL